MAYGSIVSIFDRLSVKAVLSNYTGSYIGFAATLIFMIVCLVVIIPPVNQYFTGSYFESQFTSQQTPSNIYTVGSDVIMAMVFKNKLTGQTANHTQIIQNVNSFGWYLGGFNTFKTQLTKCKPQLFKQAINPMNIEDCIMMPAGLQYDTSPVRKLIPTLQMVFSMICNDPFKCSQNSPYLNQVSGYIKNLANNYYYEFVFNSKVIDQRGRQTNQFHKIYSTEYESPDGAASWVQTIMSQKKYFVDDSINPWWNNVTYDNVYWTGKATGVDVPEGYVVYYGFLADYTIFTDYRYSYRYYKKLDFLLGMIGGAVFLIFLFFWVPCSYVNRTLQKIKNAEELLVAKDEFITTEHNLHKINIPIWYIFTKWLPGNTNNKIIDEAQCQIDIVKLIKKMKVTHRNLRNKGIDLTFKTTDVDLDSYQPVQYFPDRPALQSLQITLDAYEALTKSNNTKHIYQNNLTALAIVPDSTKEIDEVFKDQIYNKNRSYQKKFSSWKSRICYYSGECIRFFDIFGAKPMLNAEPQTSSFWGFFLTLVIILLSVLTFALTIKNMDNVKIITNYRYEKPNQNSYQMVTGKSFRFAFCFDSAAASSFLTGATKTAHLSMFKYSKKAGRQQIAYQRMVASEFPDYFQVDFQHPYATVSSQNCFKPSSKQKIQMAGSHESTNEAYFGARIDPYCSGTISQCAGRKNKTISDFVSFINQRTFGIYLSENRFSPELNKIVSGLDGQAISESDYLLNASLLRTQTKYFSSIQLLDDTSKSFLRTPPRVVERTMAFSTFGDRNQQRKGDPNADPGYIIQFRPNGQVQSIILRTYKIDFLFGIIGGSFLFWYFFVHFFAKMYNSYKVRAKLAEVLHRQDGYDQSFFIHFLYMTKLPPFILCCSDIRKDLQRVTLVDGKMERDLNYLNLIKNVDSCYRLSSALHDNIFQKDLSLVYFREKIDESQEVKPKRISSIQRDDFIDDEFLQLDDEYQLEQNQQNVSLNATSNLVPQNSMGGNNYDLQKIINMGKSNETVPLYDPFIPYKKQSNLTRIMRKLDIFKNPAQLTLDRERDVKSICGGIIFFIAAALIIIVVVHFLNLYTTGSDYTVSQRRLIDGDLSSVDSSNTLGELTPGISMLSGKNFKFAVTFNKKDQYFPLNVSHFIGPIGIRALQYTIKKQNGQIQQSYESIEFEPCNESYFKGFLGPYNDPAAFRNIDLGYCLPDGKQLTLSGTPQDSVRKYYKVSIYNKYDNSTGRSFLNSFFKIYLVQYYMSVPRLDILEDGFAYDMIKFNFYTDAYSIPLQRNITFSKVVFTNKYYSRSRQTYNDRSTRDDDRQDTNFLSSDSTRNVSFYYNGMIDHYTLDYPGGAELFGLVGGVIALFIFILYAFVSSYNEYRMKYLIGQRLYTFDKKLSGLSKQKGKKLNMKKIEEATKKINNLDELDILIAWILNPIGYLRDNYNFNKTLRRVTLLIDKVEKDINLFQVYKSLNTFKNAIDKNVKLSSNQQIDNSVNLSSVYLKQVYIPDKQQNQIHVLSSESKKHKLSSYEEFKINVALQYKVNPQKVLGDKVLNKIFGIDDGSSVLASRMRVLNQRQSVQDQSTLIRNPSNAGIRDSSSQGIRNQHIDRSESKLQESQNANQQSIQKIRQFNMQSFEIEEPRYEE